MNLSNLTKVVIATSSLLFSYSASCSGEIRGEQVSKFVQTKQYRANNPIEDRICVSEMKRFKGLLISVFDGHGGDLCAQYVSGNITRFFNQAFKRVQPKNHEMEKAIKIALQQCYDDLENGFKSVFKQNISDSRYHAVGACALTAIITPKIVVVGNAGDCEGVFLGGKKIIKTNQRLNAGEPSQQKRLKQQFPQEKDIYKCIMLTNYCYVKGRLQPTRSFGDFYLKDKQYNFSNIGIFSGPYITHKPKTTTFNLNPQLGKTLVLATDGLWDELTENEMSRQLQNCHGTQNTADKLMQAAINRILKRNYINSFQKLDKIENRRNLHDDISIITVDLYKYMQENSNDNKFFTSSSTKNSFVQ